MRTIDLEQYGREIFSANGNPGDLDRINIKLSGWYAYYSEQIIELDMKEAQFAVEMKDIESEKPKSDAYVASLWKVSEDGHDHMRVKQTLKALEKLMSNIRTSIRRAENEAYNQT